MLGLNRIRWAAGASWSRWAAACCGLMLAFLSVAASAGSFPPSESVFPATTKAWLSIPDGRGFGDAFKRSKYGQLINDPKMKPFVENFRKQLTESNGKRLANLGITPQDLENVPGGEIAAAAIEVDDGLLATVLLVDTTGHDAEADALLATIRERLVERKATKLSVQGMPEQISVYQLPPSADSAIREGAGSRQRRVAVARGPAVLVVGDHAATVADVFATLSKGRADSLASLPGFVAVTKQCGPRVPSSAAPLRWYIDPFGFAKGYQKTNPPREKRKGPDFVAILGRQGFDAVKAAGGFFVFDDGIHEMRHHAMIYAPPLAGRQPFAADRFDGAARILNFPDADTVAPPSWAPRDVSSWVSMLWDLQSAFASIESLVDDVVGEKGVFDDVIASLKEDPDGPQIDVEEDLVKCLGKRLTVVSDYAEPIDVESERLVIAIEAVDPERVAKTVAKSMSTDPDMQKVEFNGHVIWELIDRSMAIPQLEVETPGGAIAHADHDDEDHDARRRRQRLREREEKLLPHSAVTVANGHLLIASHRDFLERVLSTKGGAEALAGAADYTAVAAELQRLLPGKAAVRSFNREDESIRPAYEMLRQGSMPKSKSMLGQVLNGLLGDGKEGTVREQRIDGSTLPEFEAIRGYLGMGATGLQTLPDGWYITGFSVAKGAEPEVARRPVTPVGR
ncbi:MAG: hypothetical protein ACKOEX_07380 [Planctomycetia bacterium]